MKILDQIVTNKKAEVEERKQLIPVKLLERSLFFETTPLSLNKYLLRSDLSGIIAEFKRKSPSKGMINEHSSVEDVSLGYMQAGASALSILTDMVYFGGSNSDLETARKFNYCPILRKDFIIDEYQVIEAKSIGADAILLIAGILSSDEIKLLTDLANSLGMETLLEIRDLNDLLRACPDNQIIGVNNRNLNTFETKLEQSLYMSSLLPAGVTKVSESGINSLKDIQLLSEAGYNGFLIGEQFMRTSSPGKSCRKFIRGIFSNENSLMQEPKTHYHEN